MAFLQNYCSWASESSRNLQPASLHGNEETKRKHLPLDLECQTEINVSQQAARCWSQDQGRHTMKTEEAVKSK